MDSMLLIVISAISFAAGMVFSAELRRHSQKSTRSRRQAFIKTCDGALRRMASRNRRRRTERCSKRTEVLWKKRFRESLREMGEPETWQGEEKAAHRRRQNVSYKTDMAREAENAFFEAERRAAV